MKGAFNILNLPVLNAFLKLDPRCLPDRDSLSFESYSEEELKVLHDFYGAGKQDTFQGRMVQADALYDNFHLYYWNLDILKVMSPNKKYLCPKNTLVKKNLRDQNLT